jgi:hypothetical protein
MVYLLQVVIFHGKLLNDNIDNIAMEAMAHW